MNFSKLSLVVTLMLAFQLPGQTPAFAQTAEESKADAEVQFTLKVLPVLKTKCFACHGTQPEDLKGDLDLTSRSSMLSGGESGDPAIVVGKPDESLLIDAVEWESLEMPPKENDRLSEEQVGHLREWIQNGAVWPGEERQAEIRNAKWAAGEGSGEVVPTSGGLDQGWTMRRYDAQDIWAIKPVVRPNKPAAGYSVDAFVDQKLVEANIEPANNARPRDLIRRATYGLTGLPPRPAEIFQFEKSFRENPEQAWSDLIERLLASPHYGERWGQHWLDVVRYADTAGLSNDFELSNAWRYRDYVVRAFNNDLPFDRFVVQQIAGDELIAEQRENGNGRNNDGYHLRPAEGAVATGFLRMGPYEHTGMTPVKISRQNYLDDVTNNLGQAFLSTALRCCKCHDHKFDPIPTRDYYRIYAALAKSQPAEMKAPFLPEENRAHFEAQKKHVEKLLSLAKTAHDRIYNKREKAAREWYRERGIQDQYAPFEVRIKGGFTGKKPPRFIGLTTREEGELKVRAQDMRIWTRRLERFQPFAQSVYNGRDFLQNSRRLRPPFNKAQRNRGADNSKSFIYAGGSVYAPAEQVTPGVLSCISLPTSSGNDLDPFALPSGDSGRRLELARWIANKDNPLATRSIVNRIWHYHFGRGIAANPNNFGATGAKPTHPELLDWLTTEFIADGWSIKNLHRLIMKSNAYKRSTDHPNFEQLKIADPNNELLAVFEPRRLSAEEIRDSMLFATGELNLEIGGLPVRPEINLEVALSPRMIQFSIAPAYQPERTPDARNRRSIYAYRIRGLGDPLMEVLDKPNPNESCELRDSASTTPQVFAMLNGDVPTKRSIAMALRLESERAVVPARIERAYMLTVGEKPDRELLEKLTQHYTRMLAYHQNHQPDALKYPTRIKRSLVEELSGEAFEYTEFLDVYEDYVRDTEPADVNAETRALADICLLLFNSNQFMFLY